MAIVKLIFPYGMLKACGGEREVTISAATLGEALKLVTSKYSECLKPYASPFAKRPWLLNFFLNGKRVQHLNQIETKLEDGDVITILPTLFGG
ncbi:MoaD/ThiS family protein [Candidatus Bathyarchaeota archaeon]|nr:MoaD/ThiS family protein [Candidatus Bathyarchaeota archaeon]